MKTKYFPLNGKVHIPFRPDISIWQLPVVKRQQILNSFASALVKTMYAVIFHENTCISMTEKVISFCLL